MRPDIDCPWAKTEMTPCIARDGHLALADDSRCVGCFGTPLERMAGLDPKLGEPMRTQMYDELNALPTPTQEPDLANVFAKYVAAYVDSK